MIRDPETGAVRYFGLYRGIVADNKDPLGKNRVRLRIPQVLFQATTDWAFPLETAGVRSPIPPIGQGVWVQFEGGDPSYPVWTGTFGASTSQLDLELEQLSDVHVTAPIDGSLLRWDEVSGKWYAAAVIPETMLNHNEVTVNGSPVELGGAITVQAVPTDGSVSTAKLADGSVATAKIAGGAVTNDKLATPTTTINGVAVPLGATGTIIANTGTIADGAVTNAKLASSTTTINGVPISLGGSGTITAAPTAGTVTAASIASGGLPTTSITNFDSTIRGYQLDQLSAPTTNVALNGTVLTNAGVPVNANDVATKGYTDALVAGLNYKKEVKATTTGSNLSLSGTLTLDGVALVAGDRVLVRDQTDGKQNGLYVVATGAWARSSDGTAMNAGTYVYVDQGTLYADAAFVLTTNDPITVGTTSLTFVQFSGAGQIIAGNGLSKTGNQLAVKGTTNRVSVSSGSVDIDAAYVGQTSITTLGTVVTGTWRGSTVDVAHGGTGATSIPAGYVIGNGTAALSSVPAIPSSDVTGNGTDLITPTSVTSANPAGAVATLSGSTVNFSNAAGFTVNGVFSSKYTNYMVLVDISSASNQASLVLCLAAGGVSANAAASYWTQIVAATNSTVSTASSNVNFVYLTNTGTASGASFDMRVFNPALPVKTRFITNSITFNAQSAGNFSWEMCAGMHTLSNSYDGFSLTTNSSAVLINGSLTVYGFNLA